jgi:hypothetical protein
MYGFGDDRAPAADTVAMMEEILLEYIVDVVRFTSPPTLHDALTPEAVPDRDVRAQGAAVRRGPAARARAPRGREEARAHGGAAVHAGGHQARACAARRLGPHAEPELLVGVLHSVHQYGEALQRDRDNWGQSGSFKGVHSSAHGDGRYRCNADVGRPSGRVYRSGTPGSSA